MMRSPLTSILILVFLALAACMPGTAPVAQTAPASTLVPETPTGAQPFGPVSFRIGLRPTMMTTATASLALSPTATLAPAATATPRPTLTRAPTATTKPPTAPGRPWHQFPGRDGALAGDRGPG